MSTIAAQTPFAELDSVTVLTAVMLGQDSTGQRITFIVIGLLLAALALAILTAWYYRVTDPGPKRSRMVQGSDEMPGGGTASGPRSDPNPGPSWRKRLSGFDVPDADHPVQSGAAPQNVGLDKKDPAHQTAKAAAKEAKAAQKAKKAQVKAQGRAEAAAANAQAKADAEAAAKAKERSLAQSSAAANTQSDAAAPSGDSYLPEAPDTVSLEGGYYLDLTEVPRSDEPQTNVGSLNSLDLRQPAPLVDPDERSIPAPVAAAPAVQDTPQEQTSPPSEPRSGGLSFDDWLAGVEAIEE